MAVLYTNNASSTLSASITNSSGAFSVASGQGALFPTISGSDYFYVTLTDSSGNIEIVKVTARAIDTFTVTRAQDGTTARAFSAGDPVELRIVRALLDNLKTDSAAASLPLAGGTITGNVTLGGTTPTTSDTGILFMQTDTEIVFTGVTGNTTTNAVYNTAWKYVTSGAATRLKQTAGAFEFYTAAFGTAGATVSFGSAKATLDNTGNLNVVGNITQNGSQVVHAGNLSTQLTSYLTTASAATTYQPLDADLTAIAALSGTTGFLTKTAANTWVLDTSTYLTTSSAASTYVALTGSTMTGNLVVDVSGGSGYVRAKGNSTVTGYMFGDSANSLVGIGSESAHAVDLMVGGSGKFRFGTSGQIGIGGANYGTAGQVLTSGGAGAAPTWTNPGEGSFLLLAGGTMTGSIVLHSLADSTDSAKKATFDLSGITTANTRSFALPDVSATIAVTSGVTQTYTNVVTFANANVNFGTSTAAGTINVASGATINGATKTVNIGTGGVSGSTTTITLGASAGTTTTTAYGNVILGGTAQRIQADFNNATIANRAAFQTSTVNTATSISVLPNGTSSQSGINFFNNSDPTNAGTLNLLANATETSIRSGITGSGTYLPLTFYVNNAKAFQIGTSGQLGIGTSPDYGTSGYVLTSAGSGAAPTWSSPPGANTVATAVTAGTNAQGQGALTNDINIITTAASNPSGVTLPTAVAGKRTIVHNRGVFPIAVFPATGAQIDAQGTNTAVNVGPGGMIEFVATTTTQWYSTYNEVLPTESIYSPNDATTVDINPSNGTIQFWALTGNRTFTASNFKSGQSVTMLMSAGSSLATWPSVSWVGGSAPTLSTTGVTVIELWKYSTTLYGANVGNA